MSMPWFRAAPIVAFVPRVIGSQITSEGWSHDAAPSHFEDEANILNTRPAGKWPRLTVTLLDARISSGTIGTPDNPPPIDAVEVDVLVSVSNPDPVWNDQSNEMSRRLLGFAMGYLHEHRVKAWALNGGGGAPGVVVEWTIERKPFDQSLMNETFLAARVPLMPAIAYTVRVVQTAPITIKTKWPDSWKASKNGMLVGAEGMRAAEAYAAANKTRLVWADELVGDATALAALADEGWILAFHDTAFLVEDKVDRTRVAALPTGALVIGHAGRAKLFTRSGLPALAPG
jgi:hypothetical protein